MGRIVEIMGFWVWILDVVGYYFRCGGLGFKIGYIIFRFFKILWLIVMDYVSSCVVRLGDFFKLYY